MASATINEVSAFLGNWSISPVRAHGYNGGTSPAAGYVEEFHLSIPGETGKSHEQMLTFKAVLRNGKPVIQFRISGGG